MSQQQVVHFRLLKFLMIQLKNFGLNPTEWKIDRASSLGENEIFLVHKDDKQFQFVGNLGLRNGILAWSNLTLLSL